MKDLVSIPPLLQKAKDELRDLAASEIRLRENHDEILRRAWTLGSYLCERLLQEDHDVVSVDNFLTGHERNLATLHENRRFRFIRHDVTEDLHVAGNLDFVLHFASPASPADYAKFGIKTLKINAIGAHKMLGIAKAKRATFLLASTSEVYGDPQVNPQPETYWGHVNPVGPRSVYDEGKRFAEALAMAYHHEHGMVVKIARIFNTCARTTVAPSRPSSARHWPASL